MWAGPDGLGALRWAFLAALLQLVGSALVVWGPKIAPYPEGIVFGDGKREVAAAVAFRDRPWATRMGLVVLFLGLALQVGAAICPP